MSFNIEAWKSKQDKYEKNIKKSKESSDLSAKFATVACGGLISGFLGAILMFASIGGRGDHNHSSGMDMGAMIVVVSSALTFGGISGYAYNASKSINYLEKAHKYNR